jgi:hypothetical protein
MAMAYATINDVQNRMMRVLSTTEQTVCSNLLDDAAAIIDAYNEEASEYAKMIVSCRMVIRALGDGTEAGIPMGATQGSMSALGYSQSWTLGSGSAGELYIGKLEKKMLRTGDRIGSYSPVEEMVPKEVTP